MLIIGYFFYTPTPYRHYLPLPPPREGEGDVRAIWILSAQYVRGALVAENSVAQITVRISEICGSGWCRCVEGDAMGGMRAMQAALF